MSIFTRAPSFNLGRSVSQLIRQTRYDITGISTKSKSIIFLNAWFYEESFLIMIHEQFLGLPYFLTISTFQIDLTLSTLYLCARQI